MSNLIPPMPSSTPPPLDDNLEEDDDEEFGDFTGVDSCYNHEEVTTVPKTTTWEVNKAKMCNGDNTSQDSVQSGATDSGLCSAGEERAESGDDKNMGRDVTDELGSSSPTCDKSDPDLIPSAPSNFVSHNHLNDDPGGDGATVSDNKPDSDISNSETNSSSIYNFNGLSHVGETDAAVTFNGVEGVDQSKHIDNLEESGARHYNVTLESTEISLQDSKPTVNSTSIIVDDDFGDFADAECDLPAACEMGVSQSESWGDFNEGDGFANFEQYSSTDDNKDNKISDRSQDWACPPLTEVQFNVSPPDEDDDDFEDFETADTSNVESQVEPQLLLHESPTDVVTMLFPVVNSTCASKTVGPEAIHNSRVWCHLRDLETSNALSYQWAGSAANRLLLSSLAIDARNILFGPRWNTSVPRFAANLGLSPLEPVRSVGVSGESSTSQQSSTSLDVKPEEVPAAQFDWSVSGLVNPLDSAHSSLLDLDILNTFDNLTSSSTSDAAWRLSAPESAVKTPGIQRTSEPAQPALPSLEAQRVLSSLPDLSFLRARMLMFPVRGVDSPARAH